LKSPTLFIALFFCEAIPTFILTHHIYNYTIAFFAILLLAASLIFSWFISYQYIKKLSYAGMLIGMALSFSYFTNDAISTGILLVALSMIVGINISLRERRMLVYLLIFSFMLFLYASSIIFNKYSILTVILFTFSFFTVVITDYYNSRLQLQTSYNSQNRQRFFGTTLILVIIATIFTAVLYYLLPQPKAIHFGILAFGGPKQYKGLIDESNIKNKNHKESTNKLPQYTTDGKRVKDTTNTDLITFYKKTNTPKSKVHKVIQSDTKEEKKLKEKNKKAYYSKIEDKNSENGSLNPILFEVKGKEARFLRGNTYAKFDGKRWKKILTKMYTIQKGSRDYYSYWNGKEWQKRKISYKPNSFIYNEYFTKKSDNYTITVKGKLPGKPIIYTPVGLLRLQFPSDTFYEDAGRTIYAPSQLEINTYYTASIEREKYYGYDVMSYADVWYKKAYLSTNIPSEVYDLAKKITKDFNNPLEKAQAIIHYFQTNYKYKHASIQSPIQNQTIQEMLFKTKIGNALQFNTAFILMMRSSNVYARLVTGYAPSEYNQITHSYIVERANKAVWSEIFIKDRGWVSLHAADDIPFENEIIKKNNSNTFLTKTELIFLNILFLFLCFIFLYYAKKYIWIYRAKSRILKYAKESDINFVLKTYAEVEKYYSLYKKGKKSSCTLQEYGNYIKELKPENSYLIEYLIFYSNQATYRGKLDFDFDKERYLDVALYLIDKSFKLESLNKYIITIINRSKII